MSSFKIIVGHVDPESPEIDIDYLVEQRGLIDRFTRVLLRATRQAYIPEITYGNDEDIHYLKVTFIDIACEAQQALFGIELDGTRMPDRAGRFFHREAQAILVRFLERQVIPIGEFVQFLDGSFLDNIDVEMARILRESPSRRVVFVDEEARYEVNGQRLGGLTDLPSDIDIEAKVIAAGRSMTRIEQIKALNAPKGLRLPRAASMLIPSGFQRTAIDDLYRHSYSRVRIRLRVRVRIPKTGGTAREVILVAYPDAQHRGGA